MSQISITRTHTLSLEKARAVAEDMVGRLQKEFGGDWEWRRNVLVYERPGVNSELHVTAADIRLEARLGLLLGFLKPRIEKQIDADFDKHFRPGGGKKAAAKKAAPAARRGKKGPRR